MWESLSPYLVVKAMETLNGFLKRVKERDNLLAFKVRRGQEGMTVPCLQFVDDAIRLCKASQY